MKSNRSLYLRMQIVHLRSHVIPLRNVLLFKYLHIKESTPKSTITWSEMGTTNNEGKEVYCSLIKSSAQNIYNFLTRNFNWKCKNHKL